MRALGGVERPRLEPAFGRRSLRRNLSLTGLALATAIGAWLANRDDQKRHRRAIAVDGKTLRGATDARGCQVHLLAAMDHTTRAVLGQRQVDGAPGEVPAFQSLLSDLDLAGVVVTADALQTHREAAESWSPESRPTTCSSSRPTSPPCWSA